MKFFKHGKKGNLKEIKHGNLLTIQILIVRACLLQVVPFRVAVWGVFQHWLAFPDQLLLYLAPYGLLEKF